MTILNESDTSHRQKMQRARGPFPALFKTWLMVYTAVTDDPVSPPLPQWHSHILLLAISSLLP